MFRMSVTRPVFGPDNRNDDRQQAARGEHADRDPFGDAGASGRLELGLLCSPSADSSATSRSAIPSPATSAPTVASSPSGVSAEKLSASSPGTNSPADSRMWFRPPPVLWERWKSLGSVKSNSSAGPEKWNSSVDAFSAACPAYVHRRPRASPLGPDAHPAGDRNRPPADDLTPAFHPSNHSRLLSSDYASGTRFIIVPQRISLPPEFAKAGEPLHSSSRFRCDSFNPEPTATAETATSVAAGSGLNGYRRGGCPKPGTISSPPFAIYKRLTFRGCAASIQSLSC